jgi:hypothetical protein
MTNEMSPCPGTGKPGMCSGIMLAKAKLPA